MKQVPPKELWGEYYDWICDEAVQKGIENGGKNIVISQSNYSQVVRDYCREKVEQGFRDAGEEVRLRYIHLAVSDRGYAERLLARYEKFSEVQGWDLKDFWENKIPSSRGLGPFVDCETCVQALCDEKLCALHGYQPMSRLDQQEKGDAEIDTSNEHKGVLEELHNLLEGLDPAPMDSFYDDQFVSDIVNCQIKRMEEAKEHLASQTKALRENDDNNSEPENQ